MINTEIVPTDDPNIVIERITSEVSVDIDVIRGQILGYQTILSNLRSRASSLSGYSDVPEEIKSVVDKEILSIEREIPTYELEIERLSRFLVNG